MTDMTLIEKPETNTGEVDQIRAFVKAIYKHKSGNYPSLKHSGDGFIFPAAEGATSNRGNKLLQGSEGISRSFLDDSTEITEEKVFYNGSEHKLLGRKYVDKIETDNVDLHELVDVKRILTPMQSLGDVIDHPAVSRTFMSTILEELAQRSVLMIEKEQINVIHYSKLLEVFLGNHPDTILEDTLQLVDYNHNLNLPDEHGDEQPRKIKESRLPNGDDEDPFFALPGFDPTNTLTSLIPQNHEQVSEEIETARQLTQIALQRNQEFIRNLQKIRNCLVKANRIRRRVLAWGKEYNGIPEEDVTVPSALDMVKRGLISATTNKTMTEDMAEEESSAQEE
ncbi:LAMI_0E09538g1_1 [Lachancea mirantina]|uniref:LAMI_0E09538g1_1 n=1 Tax=Lachancea mirantina TaxID=1230905 RepID=A0A1G4JNQ2_9SACH|nr:LAMI_0E09538g1_1 [Lachancea mirantina]